ncbi:MAG: TonB-dependent receptor plug domain-containing protein [Candidatus Marinimicrobia bacterium]|nr:TonB-dependent receptor plug domain-containing protein [Candidatus Neomarinimicrobiota bacterium]
MAALISYIILLSVMTTSLSATTVVRGQVVDRKTRAPLLGANVLAVGTQDGGVTDEGGRFQFQTDRPLPLTIEITHISYQTVEVLVTSDTPLVITMEQALLKGEGVTITGKRSWITSDVSSAVVALTAESIEKLGARDLGDALRPLPSVSITVSNTGKQLVSIRGSNPNEVAVFLDGLRLNDTHTGLTDLSVIDLNDLERVEVVKGGSTTLFGQGAFGGVVSLTSRLPDSNRVTFTRGYGISDDGDQDLSFAATGRLGMFAAGGRYSGKSRHYDGSTLYTNIFHSLSAAVDPDFGQLAAKYYRLENFLQLPSGDVAQSDHTTLTHLSYSGPIHTSPDWNFFLGQRTWGWIDHFFSNLERQLDEGGMIGRITHQLTGDQLISTLQLDYERQDFSSDNITFNSEDLTQTRELDQWVRTNLGYVAVIRFLSDDANPLASKIRWEASLRRDQFRTTHLQQIQTGIAETVTETLGNGGTEVNRKDNSLISRFGVRLEGNANLVYYTFFVNQGSNQRLPTLNDLALNASAPEEESQGFPLKKERLATTDIGLEIIYRSPTYLTQIVELRFSTSFFFNQYDDKIAYRYFDDRLPVPLNIPSTKISGYDVALGGGLWENLISTQIAYQRLNLDNPLVFPNKPESRFSYQLQLNIPWLVVGYDYYRDGPQFILFNGFVGAQSLTSRESANLNIMLRWKIKRAQLSLRYIVRNLFSDRPAVPNRSQDLGGVPFQYFEAHREIITLRVQL